MFIWIYENFAKLKKLHINALNDWIDRWNDIKVLKPFTLRNYSKIVRKLLRITQQMILNHLNY